MPHRFGTIFMQKTQHLLFIVLLFSQTFWFLAEFSEFIIEWDLKTLELLEDFSELVLLAGSSFALIYFYRSSRSDKLIMEQLRENLQHTKKDLNKINFHLKKTGLAYHQAIKAQFNDWKFTSSEQEIALFIIKGLSFKEIANVRSTHEKTVRQQATVIYSKAHLKGRYEFAAYFFEDLL